MLDTAAVAARMGVAHQTLVNLVSRGVVRPAAPGSKSGGGHSPHRFSDRQVVLLVRRTRLLRELEVIRRELCGGEPEGT